MPDGTPPAYSIFQIAEEELMPDAYSIFHITEGAHTERKNSDVAEWARPPLLASSPPHPPLQYPCGQEEYAITTVALLEYCRDLPGGAGRGGEAIVFAWG